MAANGTQVSSLSELFRLFEILIPVITAFLGYLFAQKVERKRAQEQKEQERKEKIVGALERINDAAVTLADSCNGIRGPLEIIKDLRSLRRALFFNRFRLPLHMFKPIDEATHRFILIVITYADSGGEDISLVGGGLEAFQKIMIDEKERFERSDFSEREPSGSLPENGDHS